MSVQNHYQLVFFVPESHLETVKDALFSAGAGSFRNYDHCSFEVEGWGQFKPGDSSTPFIGNPGSVERIKEMRVEMFCKNDCLQATKEALLKSHPYEEVAYHFIPILT